ncbi:MAG TPA: chemotaxis protein CheA [Vicinamibacterales bacterium]|nr:chemotaxis protein CheA [Vicinamibacterales bacterium]
MTPLVESPDAEIAAFAADPELGELFVAEGIDHLSTIEAIVLQLESSPHETELLNDIFRPFHTVKGNAGVIGLTSIQEVAHRVETLLDLVRSGRRRIERADIDVVLEAVDLLTLMIRELPSRAAGHPGADVTARRAQLVAAVEARLEAGVSEEPAAQSAQAAPAVVVHPDEPARPGPDDALTTIKVDTRKLDSLVDMVGELVIAQSILAQDPTLVGACDERLTRRLSQVVRITSELQRDAMSLRMVPIRQTFQKMFRLVRELSRKADKAVDLVLTGEDTELDRKVVEQVTDPLMHMVRNAIDHGVEPAHVRAAAGKPPAAVLRVSAYHQSGNIVIEIADDGGGLNTDKILEKARERGLVAPDATPSIAEIHRLIFEPGFSTADVVTDLSGRGVGMDVVRQNIEALRGRIDVQTSSGKGTTFLIRLPLTLAIVDGLLLGVAGERFVIPTFAVRESLRPAAAHLHTVHGRAQMVEVRDHLIPLLHLGEAFAVDGARRDAAAATVVVVEDAGRTVGLVVDELLGKQEVVIKTLGAAFQSVVGVAGGAILGDGRVGLILDAAGLLALSGRGSTRTAA